MSSPPPLSSTPYPSPLNPARKRPSINTSQSENPAKRRKPSQASAISSGHPLRQTSFPPPEASELTSRPTSFSPPASITGHSSAVGSTAKRGRGGRKKAGDARSATGTSATGTDKGAAKQGTSAAGKRSAGGAAAEDDDPEEDEEDGVQDMMLEAGAIPDEAQRKVERENMRMLIEAFDEEQAERYSMSRVTKLSTIVVRRLVNQTLSQSVPKSVITTVTGYSKLFVAQLVERAREVQAEWLVAAPLLPTDEPNPNYPDTKTQSQSTTNADSAPETNGRERHLTNGIDVKEIDKGPLTPDHLREALRRYKRDRDGEGTGYQGLSLYGTPNTAIRAGGKRLFK